MPMAMLKSFNPATGAVVGEVPITPVSEVSDIVARARAVQPAWEKLGADGRAEILKKAASIFEERVEQHARLITAEMGKTLKEARGEARSVGHLERELDEMVEALQPEVVDDGRLRSTLYRDALGVCGAITPWNFPMSMPAWMVLPSLAAGNSVVFKPSEETPLCGQAYADVLNEVLPEDVLIVVHGADEQGKAVVRSDVDLIAFTGSREVGKKILREASDRLVRVVLELGGKDPLIVLDDADVAKAAEFAAWNSFRNAGQLCISTERIFVLEDIADEFEGALARVASGMSVGGGEDDPDIGPVVNARQREHVLAQLESAVAAGAKILVGGEASRDNFVSPTVLVGVEEDMDIARTETFGPIASVTRVPSVDDAVERANSGRFGLGAVIFGTDEERAAGVARRLEAGMVGINRPPGGALGTPWVGARESGFGFHKSKEGHRQFTQTRVVTRAI